MTTSVSGNNTDFVTNLVKTLCERPFDADSEASPMWVKAAALSQESFENSNVRVLNSVERNIVELPRERRLKILKHLRRKGTLIDLEMLLSALEERFGLVDLIGLKRRNESCMKDNSTSRKKKMSKEMEIACLE